MKLESAGNFTLLFQRGEHSLKVLHVADFVCRCLLELLNGMSELPNQWSAMLMIFNLLFSQMWTNVMCRVPASTSATISSVLSSASVTRAMSWHKTQSPAKVNTRTHTLTCTYPTTDCWTFAHTCLSPVQTSTNAVSPVTCASTSAWTPPGVTPASVQRDISSRETGCVKVLRPSFSSFCHWSKCLYSSSSNIIASSLPVVPLCCLSQLLKNNKPLTRKFVRKSLSSVPSWKRADVRQHIHSETVSCSAGPLLWIYVHDVVFWSGFIWSSRANSKGELLFTLPSQSGAGFIEGSHESGRLCHGDL